MSDLTHMVNSLSPDEEGHYSDAVLDYYQGLVISGLNVSVDVLTQLADREERRAAEKAADAEIDPAQEISGQDGLS